ncbi:hypothetical protein PHYBLDRAFT_180025, partial [Phycomyces blakesleeanus NRRL 1555(-)]
SKKSHLILPCLTTKKPTTRSTPSIFPLRSTRPSGPTSSWPLPLASVPCTLSTRTRPRRRERKLTTILPRSSSLVSLPLPLTTLPSPRVWTGSIARRPSTRLRRRLRSFTASRLVTSSK